MQDFSRMYPWTCQPPHPVRIAKGNRIRLENSVLRKSTGTTALSFKDAFLKES